MTDKTAEPRLVRLDLIHTGETQVRERTDDKVVEDYAALMEGDFNFPPIVIFSQDGLTIFWLADGFRRVAAAKKLGLTEIEAVVHGGTKRDAILYALDSNAKHGVQLTKADCRRAAALLLRDREVREWSSRELGRLCGLHGKTVEKLREKITAEVPQTRKAIRKGKSYDINTRRIGPRKKRSKTDLPDLDEPDEADEVDEWGPPDEQVEYWVDETPPGRFSVVVVAPSSSDAQNHKEFIVGLAAKDAVLWYWTTSAGLPEALKTVKRWDFTYKTTVTWLKPVPTVVRGAWIQEQTEHFVVATRGDPKIFPKGTTAIYQEKVTDYSDLTDFHRLVEQACPDAIYAEVFAKKPRRGWTTMAWSHERQSWREL